MADETFSEGTRFNNFQEFSDALNEMQRTQRHVFIRTNSKTGGLSPEDHFLKFSYATYSCERHGKFKSTGKGIRRVSSKKCECPATIKIQADRTTRNLKVTQSKLHHNHSPREVSDEETSSSEDEIEEMRPSKRVRKNRHEKSVGDSQRDQISKSVRSPTPSKPPNEVAACSQLTLETSTSFTQAKPAQSTSSCTVVASKKKIQAKRCAESDGQKVDEGKATAMESIQSVAAPVTAPSTKVQTKIMPQQAVISVAAATCASAPDLVDVEIPSTENSEVRPKRRALAATNHLKENSASVKPASKIAAPLTCPEVARSALDSNTGVSSEEVQIKRRKNGDGMAFAENEAATTKLKQRAASSGKGLSDKVQIEIEGEQATVPVAQRTRGSAPDLTAIEMPNDNKRIGRPKGRALTAIGLPVKAKNQVAFVNKCQESQIRDILSWLIDSKMIDVVISAERTMQKTDLKLKSLRDSIVDKSVDLNLLTPYFNPAAFTAFKRAVAMKKKRNMFHCSLCEKVISEKNIMCNHCLLWFHYKCVNLNRAPRSKYWFCPECKK